MLSRKELEQNLIKTIIDKKLKTKKKQIKEIQLHLTQYDLFEGDIQSWINDPETYLHTLDSRVLYLFTEQVFAKTGDSNLNPELYYTDMQIKESKQYSGSVEERANELSFPITIPNATLIGNNAYMVTLDIKTIDSLMNNQLLIYDPELQRELKFVKRKGVMKPQPTLIQKNVKEITQHLIDGTLVPTVLVFNAALRSGQDDTELIYDTKRMELTINRDVTLAIVDGFHRIMSSQNALRINPNIEFNFAVLITNYSKKKAQQYQAQLAQATPISKVRIQELAANRPSSTIIQQLKDESDLKGRISQTNRIHSLNNELVTYNLLSDTLEEDFDIEKRGQQADVGDYLVEFVNMLFDCYPDAFKDKINETRKTSLINDNNIIGVGYLTLARRMMENGIKARDVRKYIEKINFDRNNPLWEQIGVLNSSKNIADTPKARKAIRDYFEKLEL